LYYLRTALFRFFVFVFVLSCFVLRRQANLPANQSRLLINYQPRLGNRNYGTRMIVVQTASLLLAKTQRSYENPQKKKKKPSPTKLAPARGIFNSGPVSLLRGLGDFGDCGWLAGL